MIFYPYNSVFVDAINEGFYRDNEALDLYLTLINRLSKFKEIKTISKVLSVLSGYSNIYKVLVWSVFSVYYWIIMLFLSCLCYGMIKLINDKKSNLLFIVSIFPLGCTIYYINRPSYGNQTLVLPLIFVVLCILINKNTDKFFTYIIIGFVLLISYASVLSLPKTIESISNSNSDIQYIEAYEKLSKVVPKNAYIVGIGGYETCGFDYKNICNVDDIDFNINNKIKEKIIEEIQSNNNVVVFTFTDDRLWGRDFSEYISKDFCLINSYTNDNISWKYYQKTSKKGQ